MEAPLYQNKSFIHDGVGKASLLQVFDGDTASFLIKDNYSVVIRFLGIDCPECTKKVEPFGKEALIYTKTCLENANLIVLEADGDHVEHDYTKNRFLAYIWYGEENNLKLLNLELVKKGYAKLLIMNNVTKYNLELTIANEEAKKSHLGVYGDLPNDFYSIAKEISISDLVNNEIDNDGKTIRIEGIVVRKLSNSFFISDNVKGIYVYNTHYDISRFNIGDRIKFVAQFSIDNIYGSQLTNIRGVEILEKDCDIFIPDIYDFDNINDYVGKVVCLKSFYSLGYECITKQSSGYYIDGILGKTNIKIKASESIKNALKKTYFKKGKLFDLVVGIITYRKSFSEEKKPMLVFCNDMEKDIEELEE